MRITDKQLNNVPVYTSSDTFIGYVVGLELDVETHAVIKYFVTEHKLVPERWRSLVGATVFDIAPSQVVALRSDRMVVQDGSVDIKVAHSAAVPTALA